MNSRKGEKLVSKETIFDEKLKAIKNVEVQTKNSIAKKTA